VFALAEFEGPVYMRLARSASPVFEKDYPFEIGKANVLREGKDVAVFACGLMVSETLAAAELLAADGIEISVINVHTIKPIDEEIIIKAAKETGAIVTVEEHSVIGGLGAAVCECLSEEAPCPVLRVGVEDKYGRSGKVPELLEIYGLTAKNIYEKAKLAVSKK
jgi:transketolase